MVNENNKYIPKVPETFIVAELKDQETKVTPLSTAQSKVIRRWGGGYVSERATMINPSYGPGVDSPETHYCKAEGCYEKIDDSLTYCSKHSQVSSSSSSTTVTSSKAEQSKEEGTTYHADGSVTKYKKETYSVSSSSTTTS